MIRWIYILIIVVLLGCQESFNNEQEMFSYLNNPENGLVKEKNINGIKLKVKLLPTDFLTYKELRKEQAYTKEIKQQKFDSYDSTYVFVLNIGPSDEQDFSIQHLGITNYQEYKQRVLDMNFEITEFVKVKANNKEYMPVLSNMENVYGLSKSRNIYLVFAPDDINDDLLTSEKLDFVFNDEIFHTGINHFVFNRKDILKIPKIEFWKTIN